MIYYPLSILMLAGIQDILIITTPHDQQSFINLLGSGKQLGLNITYEAQPSPDGLAQAVIIGEKFIGDDNVCLVLGDNIFYGHGMDKLLENAMQKEKGASVFGYYVKDPECYGVFDFDKNRKLQNLLFDYHCDWSFKKGRGTKDLKMLKNIIKLNFDINNTIIIDDYDEVADTNQE